MASGPCQGAGSEPPNTAPRQGPLAIRVTPTTVLCVEEFRFYPGIEDCHRSGWPQPLQACFAWQEAHTAFSIAIADSPFVSHTSPDFFNDVTETGQVPSLLECLLATTVSHQSRVTP